MDATMKFSELDFEPHMSTVLRKENNVVEVLRDATKH
jgi:hypothetical protein